MSVTMFVKHICWSKLEILLPFSILDVNRGVNFSVSNLRGHTKC